MASISDIPSAPELILGEIRSREIHVAWKAVEIPSSTHRHIIHVNRKKVGETKRSENAVVIHELAQHTLYEIRVFAVSAAGFHTPSQALYVRTTPCQTGDATEDSIASSPTIRIHHTKATPAVSTILAPWTAREASSGQIQCRHLGAGRKHSSAGLPQDQNSTAKIDGSSQCPSEDEDEIDIAQLQDRFQKVQQESEAAEYQVLQEEKEFESTIKNLESRRDRLKQSLKERDDAGADLRKQVHKLESASRAAQSERSKKERMLQQKEGQRAKRRAEVSKWEAQMATMADEIAGIEKQKTALKKRTANSMKELQQHLQEEQIEVKGIDEDNKEKTAQIKALEEERKRLNGHEETDESREADHEEWHKDRRWQENIYNLHVTYTSLANSVSTAKMGLDVVKERLASLQRARCGSMQLAYPIVPPPDVDAFRQGVKQRRSRQPGSLTSNSALPMGTLPNLDAFASPPPPRCRSISISPAFASGSNYFSRTNGMTLMGPPDAIEPASEDLGNVTGSTPMSPGANSLLPANLLGDESADDLIEETRDEMTHGPSVEGVRTWFSSVGRSNVMAENHSVDPSSPQSSSSRSPSIFLSPRESLNFADADGRSTHSTQVSGNSAVPPAALATTSRNFVSGIFGFNRQRGRTTTGDSPTLGTLKPGESQSFPRNVGEGLDPLARRRRLSYGGNWAAPVANLFPRNAPGEEDKVGGMSRASSSRRAFPSLFSSRLNPANLPVFAKQPAASSGYDQFAPRNDSMDFAASGNRKETSTSRPSSVYSFDRLPRPSTENSPFGWGAHDRLNLRGSPLGPDWSVSQTWSRSQSRRQSLTYGSASNISMSSPSEDVFEEANGSTRPLQAPIGTRPPSSRKASIPKLNPAAPSFNTLFARTKPREKGKVKDAEGLKPSPADVQAHDASPSESRKSKDSRSVATVGSLAESGESLDKLSSGGLSDTPPSKETFIQKMTRKSSSNKFNAWKEKGGLFSRKGDATTSSELEEDTSADAQLGRSLESVPSTPFSEKEKDKDKEREKESVKGAKAKAGWNFMRKSKRGERSDLAASEVSESSERTSEAWDEDGHDHHASLAYQPAVPG